MEINNFAFPAFPSGLFLFSSYLVLFHIASPSQFLFIHISLSPPRFYFLLPPPPQTVLLLLFFLFPFVARACSRLWTCLALWFRAGSRALVTACPGAAPSTARLTLVLPEP